MDQLIDHARSMTRLTQPSQHVPGSLTISTSIGYSHPPQCESIVAQAASLVTGSQETKNKPLNQKR